MSDWKRLRELVEGALQKGDAERDAWLASECAGDDALLLEARELVAASLEDEEFLTPAAPALTHEPVLPEGARIGPYLLTGVIATGGMGTVYLAERESPARRVALKVMRTGLGSPASVARFRYEVEVLASLRHPNIAHMYETGVQETEDRRELPWFAMEYVEGSRSITAYAGERELSPTERIELFRKVCDAVHHGHGRGVIHRDLKPDNLLVDEHGVPKVIDFGVARAVSAGPASGTLRTSQGEIVGTLAYMSPEQVSGKPDAIGTRSDVYSLGVVLFELLTGALPYDLAEKGIVASARIIEEEPPRRAGQVEPAAGGDLETILAKCLEKDPDRRYESAAALGADLRRYLAREPIEAHPPSVTYQLGMFVRRHRILVGSACLVLLVAAVAAVVVLDSLARARRSERVALDREAAANEARDRAHELFGKLLDRSVTSTFELAPRLRDLAGGTALNSEVIENAVADLEALEAEAGDDPAVRIRIAYAHLRLGDARGNPAYPNLGDREGAKESYARAMEIAEALEAQSPGDPEVRSLTGVTRRNQGVMALTAGETDRARELLTRSLTLFEALVREHPEDKRYRAELGNSHEKLLVLTSRTGDLPGAKRHAREYARIFGELLRDDPGEEGLALQVALSHQQLAGIHWKEGEFAAARDEWDLGAKALGALAEKHPQNTLYRMKLAWCAMWAGGAERRLGNLDSAGERLTRAVREYRELMREDPSNSQYPSQFGNACWMLAVLYEDRADREGAPPDEVRGHLDRAVKTLREGLLAFETLKEEGRILKIHERSIPTFTERIAAVEARIASLPK